MTDSTPSEVDDSAQTESEPNFRRAMEARAKAGDEALVKLAALERTLLFRDANIDPSSKKNEYFIKGYDGELTVDAIREEATAVGLYENASAPAEEQINMGAEQRIAAAADDAGPVTNPDLIKLIGDTSDEVELRALMEANGHTWNAAV